MELEIHKLGQVIIWHSLCYILGQIVNLIKELCPFIFYPHSFINKFFLVPALCQALSELDM